MDRPDISFEKGTTYKDMGLLDEAIAEFRKAMADETLRCRASREIASCLVLLDRIDDAEKVLLQGLLAPDLSKMDRLRIYTDLAEVHVQQGRIESAVERLIQVRNEDSNFFPALKDKIRHLYDKIVTPLSEETATGNETQIAAADAFSSRATGMSPEEIEEHFQDARRRTPRVRFSTPVQYSFDQSVWSTGYSSDISTGGMFVLTHEPVPVGSLVFLKFNLPHADRELHMELIGQAVRQESKRYEQDGVLGMGIQFVSVEPEHQMELRAFVAELYSGEGENGETTGKAAKIRFHCDHCSRRVTALETLAGKTGKCLCGKPVLIPYATHTPSADNPLRGFHIAGCRIDRVIGKGSAATVYKAHHVTLDIPVAVKILDPAQQKAGTLMAERFLKEARVIARIKHANIVDVMNAGMEKGYSFIVMQLVAGSSLNDMMLRGERISVSDGIRVFIDVCKALQAAHEHSVIHGDVKPANILLTPGGTAMLVDFGLVKEMKSYRDQKDTGLTMGTPLYMPPEQARGGHAVEYRSDIYSLGATMYHVFAGEPPFDGLTVVEVVRKHMKEKPIPLIQRVPDAPKTLSDVLAKCLAKSPQNRFESVSQIKQILLTLTREMAVRQFKPIYSKLKKRKPKLEN